MSQRCAVVRVWSAVVIGVLVVVGGAVRPVAADLQRDVERLVLAAGVSTTSGTGVSVIDLNSRRELVAIGGDAPLAPASNLKLVTTAAALATLGPDFAFRTELRLVGNDTLVVKGDGDPAFFDPKLMESNKLDTEKLIGVWVKAVQDAGVKKVARIVVDDRIFDHEMVNSGWKADSLDKWYGAPVSGVNFFDNCFDVYASGGANGTPAKIQVLPAAPFLNMTNRAVAGSVDKFLVNRKAGGNDLQFSGTVKGTAVTPVSVPMHDPSLVFGQVLADRLVRAGVSVGEVGRPSDDSPMPAGKTLHVIQSTLPVVLGRCCKDSQNLFAESLCKRLGAAATGKPGSWQSGTDAEMQFLARRIGADALTGVKLIDGSGLARDDRVTARLLARLLAAMYPDPKLGRIYRDSLSIAGTDGTLAHRLDKGVAGQVYGKSGYIDSVSTLSGYIVYPGKAGDRVVVFSLLFNNFKPDVGTIKKLQDDIVKLVDREAVPTAEAERLGG